MTFEPLSNRCGDGDGLSDNFSARDRRDLVTFPLPSRHLTASDLSSFVGKPLSPDKMKLNHLRISGFNFTSPDFTEILVTHKNKKKSQRITVI